MNEVYINIKNFNESWIGKKLQEEFKKDLISIEELISYVEDLADKVEDLEDKYKTLQQDLEDNYVSRPMSDYTGDSYDDRF